MKYLVLSLIFSQIVYCQNNFEDSYSNVKDFVSKGETDEALDLLELLAKRHPDEQRIWRAKGHIYMTLENYEKSIVNYEKALDLGDKEDSLKPYAVALFMNNDFNKLQKISGELKDYNNNVVIMRIIFLLSIKTSDIDLYENTLTIIDDDLLDNCKVASAIAHAAVFFQKNEINNN